MGARPRKPMLLFSGACSRARAQDPEMRRACTESLRAVQIYLRRAFRNACARGVISANTLGEQLNQRTTLASSSSSLSVQVEYPTSRKPGGRKSQGMLPAMGMDSSSGETEVIYSILLQDVRPHVASTLTAFNLTKPERIQDCSVISSILQLNFVSLSLSLFQPLKTGPK